ncbi:hypothetical protein GCM10023163_20540 [Aestuariibaculum suncheonense]
MCKFDKVKAGIESNYISTFWDVLYICSDVLNQAIPKQVNDVSIVNILLGNSISQKEHEFLLFEYIDKKY